MDGACILIVDSQPAERNTLQDTLREAGYQTDIAATGWQALDKLWCGRFDLIVQQWRHDDLIITPDCLQVFYQFRQQHPATPVIVLAEYCSMQTSKLLFQAGAASYHCAPLPPGAFLQAVEKALRQGQKG